MKLSRRDFIHAGCTVVATNLILHSVNPAEAGLHMHGSFTGFNGGVTQTNLNNAEIAGQWIFINFLKGAQEVQYLSPPTDPAAPTKPILELDSNGYPTSIVAGTGGYGIIWTIPNASTYTGKWVLKWDGTGTVTPANFSFTTTLSVAGRIEFTNNDNTPQWTSGFVFVTATNASPNHVKNLRMCRIGDEALMDAGQLIFPDHLTLMKSAKPGAIRSLGWGGNFNGTNTALIGLWSQRKPTTYITYGGQILNPNWWGGTTTRSGTDYSLAYSGFTLTDKVAVHLIFNADITAQTTLLTKAWSTTNGVAININWTAHGLIVGNTVVTGQNSGGTISPPGMNSAQIYFINNVIDANNFTISATSGGSSVLATATNTGNMFISAVPRININGTGFVKMTDFQTPVPSNIGSINGVSPAAGLATIIYDQTTGWFHISRSDNDGVGLTVGSPPEIFIDYCAQIGSNPWLTAPFMTQTTGGALGGVTDFMTSWVTYAKNTYPWMKPLIEPYNETWNPGLAGLGTHYAQTLAYTLWSTQALAGGRPIDNSYGKWVSDLGQAISSIYGADRTKYSMLCMGQAATFHDTASLSINDARLTSDWYVTVSGGQPAYKFCDRVGAACYFDGPQSGGVSEIVNAFNYSITNAGNPSAQLAIAETYVGTSNTGVDTFPTLAYVKTLFTNIKAWAQGQNVTSTVPTPAGGNTVKGMCTYEGGWGPDVPIADWFTSVSSAAGSITQANPCVLTLNTNSTGNNDGGTSGLVGNPSVIGQMINLQFVSGMTQINNPGLIASGFTSGSASIAATQTLIANQAVMFVAGGSSPPSPFVLNTPYHVISTGLSGSAFQLSVTKGGTAIVAGANASSVFTQEGWFITAVGTSTITLDLDSTGFSAWTNAATGLVTWTGSGAYSNTLRLAAVSTSALGTANTQMYTDFFGLGGGGWTAEYPSNFLYFGTSGAWSVLNPNIYAPLTPQWNSIVTYNH